MTESPLWRVVFNRDEQRTRPAALPPVVSSRNDVRLIAPVDPVGGGTWIAASSAGLVVALLNEYQGVSPPQPSHLESRGFIIPSIAAASSLAAARRVLDALDLDRYLPFRLVAADDAAVWEAVYDGRRLRDGAVAECATRIMRTSSSVEAARARACRTALFARLVPQPSRPAQDRFHAYWRAGEPALGVHMARGDARTVSTTTVDVFADHLRMAYRPLSPDALPDVTRLRRVS